MPLGTLGEVLEHHAEDSTADSCFLGLPWHPKASNQVGQTLLHLAPTARTRHLVAAADFPLVSGGARRRALQSAFDDFLVVRRKPTLAVPSDVEDPGQRTSEPPPLQSEPDDVDGPADGNDSDPFPVYRLSRGQLPGRDFRLDGPDTNTHSDEGHEGNHHGGSDHKDDHRDQDRQDNHHEDEHSKSASHDHSSADKDDKKDSHHDEPRSSDHSDHEKTSSHATKVIVITENAPDKQHVVEHHSESQQAASSKDAKAGDRGGQAEGSETQETGNQSSKDANDEDREDDQDGTRDSSGGAADTAAAAKDSHVRPTVVAGGAVALCAQAYLWGTVFVTLFKPPRRSGPDAQLSQETADASTRTGEAQRSADTFAPGAAVGRIGEEPRTSPHVAPEVAQAPAGVTAA
eukprot:TRINITY_DN120917_c0_g1_i1.p1 TRINITY_DN120917_c0_g1~~TRINITY_DN120917_c0_g1_i1.p1  ORF type:complete len:403 (-),score=51.05 TRINITY_DN120917_c0_g1_i1:20-1228(-)